MISKCTVKLLGEFRRSNPFFCLRMALSLIQGQIIKKEERGFKMGLVYLNLCSSLLLRCRKDLPIWVSTVLTEMPRVLEIST